MFENVINISEDQRTLFSNDKGTTGTLKRLGLPVIMEKESGVWFDLQDVTIELKIKKKRSEGFKTTTL